MKKCIGPRDENRALFGISSDVEALATNSAMNSTTFALPGDQPNYLRDRNFALKHIKLSVKFDLEAKQVIGIAELTLEAITPQVRIVELDCDDTEVNSVKYNRQDLSFTLSDGMLITEIPSSPIPGKPFKLVIDYVSTPSKGIYFTGPDDDYPDKPLQVWTQGQDTNNHNWFPCIDEPRGRLTSEIVVTVPCGWTAVSNGRLISERSNRSKGTKTFHWLQDREHAVYLITLVAAEFSRVVLQEAAKNRPLIDFYCQPGREEDGLRAFGNTVSMITLYEDLFGIPYPWDKYTQVAVQDFIFGGMENTSATTQTDLTLHDERAHLDFSSDFLVAHEAVHQWFGDLITCREWAHGWLNEGFATYFESVWQEHHRGNAEYLNDIQGMANSYLSERYRRPLVERTYNLPIDIFDRHLYEKGGLVLHMLRRELGDELFYKAIRHYAHSYTGRNVVTLDFQRAIEESTGRNMDWFFDQWVFSPGHPEFKVDYSWDETNKTATLNIRQTQDGASVPRAFRATVQVVFVTSEGRNTFLAELTERGHTLTYLLSNRPKMVQFDAGYGVLKTLNFKKPKDLLIYQLRHDEDVTGRMDAARGLADFPTQDSLRALKRAVLRDSFWGVQSAAARSLGNMKSDRALDILRDCRTVDHPKARRGVAAALGEFKNERSAKYLSEMLDNDESYYVAMVSAASLGKTQSKHAYDKLVAALDRESHLEAIRSGAFFGLSSLKDERAIEVAKKWVRPGNPPRSREAAIGVLGQLGEGNHQITDALIDLLDDNWLRVRQSAVSALARLKDPRAINPLRALASRDLDGRVVRDSREAISTIRQGKNAPDDVKKLRVDVVALEEENMALKQRLEKLEQRVERNLNGNGRTMRRRRPK